MSKNTPCINLKINKPKITIFNVLEPKQKRNSKNNIQKTEKPTNKVKLEKNFLTSSSSDFKSLSKTSKAHMNKIQKISVKKQINNQSNSEKSSIVFPMQKIFLKKNNIAQSLSNLREVLEENFSQISPNRNNNRNLLKNTSCSHKINKYICNHCSHFSSNFVKNLMKRNLFLSNMKSINENNRNAIDFIIYNVKCHLVCLFKEYLIFNDLGEFLKRSYTLEEAKPRIIRATKFYNNNLVFFPMMSSMDINFYFNKNLNRRKKIVQIKHEEIEEIENASKSQLTTFLKSAYLELLRKDDKISKSKMESIEFEHDIFKILENISTISKTKLSTDIDYHSLDKSPENYEFDLSEIKDIHFDIHEEKSEDIKSKPLLEIECESANKIKEVNKVTSNK